MIRVLGSCKRFCDGLTRRDLLHVGALAPLGRLLDLAACVSPPSAAGLYFKGREVAKEIESRVYEVLGVNQDLVEPIDGDPSAAAALVGAA